MITRKFWPLDFDTEGEIFDNLSFDLPGFRRDRKERLKNRPSEKPPVRR